MTGGRPLSSPDSGDGIYGDWDPGAGVVPSMTLLNSSSHNPSNPALNGLAPMVARTNRPNQFVDPRIAYSSRRFKPLEIWEENTRGSIVPATRQVFSVEDMAAAEEDQSRWKALLIHDARPLRMAFLANPLTDQYETTAGEVERPVTPLLAERFKAISGSRFPIDNDTRESYEHFYLTYCALHVDNRITYEPAARNVWLHNVIDVDMVIGVIVVAPDSDVKLGTGGVANCMVCAGRTPSRLQPGYTVLAMIHYSGMDPETNQPIGPRGILQKLVDKILAAGGDRGELEIMLVGGEYASIENDDAHRLHEEYEFLEARDTFPIVAARIPTTVVDTNSSGETIMRHTFDDNNVGIDAVISKESFVYSHGKLYAPIGRLG